MDWFNKLNNGIDYTTINVLENLELPDKSVLDKVQEPRGP